MDDDLEPAGKRCLVLAPHPDDFDVVAVTLRHLREAGAELFLEVLTSGASGVEDDFVAGWESKADAREREQAASCEFFGLELSRLKFHRLEEDETGAMIDNDGNVSRVRSILDRIDPDLVILPHGNDSNADHRRTHRMFDAWARGRSLTALLVKDPKTLGLSLDLIAGFGEEEAEWKGEMLRFHATQHERNLRSRGIGIDRRILDVNREIAREVKLEVPYAEGFEISIYQS